MLILIQMVDFAFQIYMLMLFARILCSWLPELQEYSIMIFIRQYTDPYLDLFRRVIPPLGMIDISPIFAFICLGFIEKIVKTVLIALIR